MKEWLSLLNFKIFGDFSHFDRGHILELSNGQEAERGNSGRNWAQMQFSMTHLSVLIPPTFMFPIY